MGSRGNGSEALQERGLVPAQPQFTALPTDLGRGHAHGVRRQWAPHCPSPANWLSFATVPAHQCSEPSLGLLRALAVFELASFSSIPITLIRDHLCLFN